MDSSEWVLCRHVFYSLCLKLGSPTVDFTPNSTACCMEIRSLQHSIRRNVNSLDTGSLLRIFSILSDAALAQQNTTRPSTLNKIGDTLLANTAVKSRSVGNVNKETNSVTKFNHTVSRSKKESLSIIVEQKSYINDRAGFREGLSFQRVSEETTQLIAKSRRQGNLGRRLGKAVWLVLLMER